MMKMIKMMKLVILNFLKIMKMMDLEKLVKMLVKLSKLMEMVKMTPPQMKNTAEYVLGSILHTDAKISGFASSSIIDHHSRRALRRPAILLPTDSNVA